MAKRGSNYTPLGRKIKALAKNQSEIAQVLGLTQQSISGKFCGKIAVSIDDLEKLSAHFDVPIVYFFMDSAVDALRAKMVSDMLKTFDNEFINALGQMTKRPAHVQNAVSSMARQAVILYDQGQMDGARKARITDDG
jgi:transcriptional regulator with XRE-family HTH domain